MCTLTNIYQNSRKTANYTQEQAAEFLHIAPRTIGSYETGAAIVPDDVVDRMIDLYKDNKLGYLHLQANPIARRYLPTIEDRSLSQAALSLLCASTVYSGLQAQLMMMCSDGKIDSAEAGDWSRVNAAIDKLVEAAYTLRFVKAD
jgi:hypothetical protein